MKSLLLLAVCCCFFAGSSTAQTPVATGTIKGTVLDSLKNEPMSYVTVLVQEVGKDQPIKSVFTQDNGSFEIAGLPIRLYQLRLAVVGAKSKVVRLPAFPEDNPVINIGKVMLTSTMHQLKEVQVTAEKVLVTQDIDKITYNVEADPESNTINALDMLRKVPLLAVDAEDNITMNGSGSYRILINGKTSSLFVRNPKDVFKSMPANSIKSIEVITNPPSKYEAEGVGGIINIITHKKNIGGYNGSINSGISDPRGMNLGGYFTAKAGKFGFSGYYGYNTYTSPTNPNSFNRIERVGDAVRNQLLQNGENNNEGTFQYFSGEMSFEIDTLNLLSATYSINASNGSGYQGQRVRSFGSDGALNQAFNRLTNSTNSWSGSDFGADYQRTFKRNKEQIFTLSYKLNTNGNASNSDFLLEPVFNYARGSNIADNDGRMNEHTFQADYVYPFLKHTLEAGVKTIFRLNSSDYYLKRLVDEDRNLYETDPALSNSFDYRQDIYAAYTALSLKKDKWGLKFGARLEETRVDANFKSSGTVAEQNFFNLIPNITISRTLKAMSTVRLSYTQRIERPYLYFINPYVNVVDTFNISYGNPNLEAATNNVYTLAYNTFIKGSSINASLFHNFTNNSIQQYTTLGDDNISRTTFGNIGKNQTYGMSLNGNTTLFKKLSLNLNGTLNYVQLRSMLNNIQQDNSGITSNVFGYASYRFEKGWRASGNIGYNSPWIMLQGRSAGYMFNSISASKQFLKDNKATVSVSVSNPFQKDRRFFNEIEGENFYQVQESYFRNRRFSLSFNYRFGKLQGDITRKKRGIKNDDVSGGGGQQQGTGN